MVELSSESRLFGYKACPSNCSKSTHLVKKHFMLERPPGLTTQWDLYFLFKKDIKGQRGLGPLSPSKWEDSGRRGGNQSCHFSMASLSLKAYISIKEFWAEYLGFLSWFLGDKGYILRT